MLEIDKINLKYLKLKEIFLLINIFTLFVFFYHANKNITYTSKNILLDFPAFYIAGKISLEDKSPYKKENTIDVSKKLGIPYTEYRSFLYPPQSLLFFRYLAKLDIYDAQKLITILKEFSLLLAVFILAYINYNNSIFYNSINPLLLLHSNIFLGLFLSSFFWPVKNDLLNGQVNILIYFLLLLSFYFSEKKPFITGICLSLSILLKLTPLFLLPYFILKSDSRIKIFISIALTTVIISFISLIIIGLETHIDFINNLFLHTKENHIPILGWPYSVAHNQSITGFFNRLFINNYQDEYFGTEVIYYNIFIGKLFIIISIIFICYKTFSNSFPLIIVEKIRSRLIKFVSEKNNDLVFGLFLSSTLLISPVTWVHHMVTLILPIIIVFNYFLMYLFKGKYNLPYTFIFLISILFLLISHLYPLNKIFILGILFSYIHLLANLSIFFLCLYFINSEFQDNRGIIL